MKYRVGILTLSDKAFCGEREDLSGAMAAAMVKEAGYEVVYQTILSDAFAPMKKELARIWDEDICDLLLTTGGTGFSKRDVTPEATMEIAQRNAPGIAEAMRYHSMTITPRAMLSRGVSVIRKETLIVNLPGSVKAVRENLAYILPTLSHGLDILKGQAAECGAAYEEQCEGGQKS